MTKKITKKAPIKKATKKVAKKESKVTSKTSNLIKLNSIFPSNSVKYTLDIALSKAKECKNRAEFSKKFSGAYNFLKKKSHLAELNKIFPVAASTKWTVELALAKAKSCKTRAEFMKKFSGAYSFLKRNKCLC